MDRNTFAKDISGSQALTASTIDLNADLLAVIDASETRGSAKIKHITGAELAKAVKNDQAQLLKIALTSCRNSDGTLLAAAAAAGKVGITMNAGTSEVLTGEVASSNTKTDIFLAEVVLPANYVAATDVGLVINAQQVGTATVKTLAAAVYEVSDAGAHSANLTATAAQSLTGSAAEYTYTIDGTNLVAGDRLLIKVTSVSTEAAAGNTNAQINSLRLTY